MMKETIRNRQNELNLGRAVDEVYGIGIENTILRMCLFFDGKFQYKLENAESGGFCVKMWIAAEEEQEDEKKNTGFDS